jgi:glycosyltransferase involved in cell wall biosynthesis
MPAATVVVVQRIIPHYRVPFFEELRTLLAARDIELVLLCSRATASESVRRDTQEIPWARRVRVLDIGIGRRTVDWQCCFRAAARADLVIVEHANRHLLTFALMALRARRRPRSLAFWGHGRDWQSPSTSPGAALRRWSARRADWWFAYTDRSAAELHRIRVRPELVTVVHNSTDTRSLSTEAGRLSQQDLARARVALQLGDGPVGLYVGGMYPNKRLEFLIDAASRVRESVPDFELVLCGDGPGRPTVDQLATSRPWLHVLDPILGPERATLFALADLVLCPGLVGLLVADSFAVGTPLVTAAVPFHSPEISYLRPGENGLIVEPPDDERAYAAAIVGLLTAPERLARLAEGAREAGGRLSVETMAKRFADGVASALAAAP